MKWVPVGNIFHDTLLILFCPFLYKCGIFSSFLALRERSGGHQNIGIILLYRRHFMEIWLVHVDIFWHVPKFQIDGSSD